MAGRGHASAYRVGVEVDPSRLMWQGMDVVACIRDLGLWCSTPRPRTMITPGLATRGAFDTSFGHVPADAPDKSQPTLGPIGADRASFDG
jgi:hypothetical protein